MVRCCIGPIGPFTQRIGPLDKPAERLLRAATLVFEVVDPCSPDARQAVVEYFEELAARFTNGFEPADAIDFDAFAFGSPDEAFVLSEAIAMYETTGYRSIDRYNDNPYAQHWFEKELSP